LIQDINNLELLKLYIIYNTIFDIRRKEK
jgi:hypothetical protein